MKAMVLAAGLGTRLRPLTNDRPKALVEVGGLPLLEICLRRLKYCGFKEVVVNVHHFGEQIIGFLRAKRNFGLDIVVSDERGLLLDTGGALRKAARHLEGAPFLMINADILTNTDLGGLMALHRKTEALALLAVRDRESSRQLLFDATMQLVGWRNNRTGEERRSRSLQGARPLAFSGIQVIHPDLFAWFPPGETVFSIIDVYLAAARESRILGVSHDADLWLDVGKLPALEQAPDLLPQIPMAD